ncbi:MAG: peptidoglycan domain protein [Muribaculaceae bacterium]|nr:peptidoglycan domain protein [Muribaculaceae bacterium]
MANFERMIPFVLHFAAGVYGKNGEELRLPFEEQFLLAKKRGWSDDSDDPGGATMIDVTLSTYSCYMSSHGMPRPGKEDLRGITFGEWKDILKTMYWDKWMGDELRSAGVAHLLVDWIWGSGSGVIRDVQRLVGVKADGIVGPRTLSAVNGSEQEELFGKIYEYREAYYRKCRGAWKYLAGWLRRLEAIRPDGTFRIYGNTY